MGQLLVFTVLGLQERQFWQSYIRLQGTRGGNDPKFSPGRKRLAYGAQNTPISFCSPVSGEEGENVHFSTTEKRGKEKELRTMEKKDKKQGQGRKNVSETAESRLGVVYAEEKRMNVRQQLLLGSPEGHESIFFFCKKGLRTGYPGNLTIPFNRLVADASPGFEQGKKIFRRGGGQEFPNVRPRSGLGATAARWALESSLPMTMDTYVPEVSAGYWEDSRKGGGSLGGGVLKIEKSAGFVMDPLILSMRSRGEVAQGI